MLNPRTPGVYIQEISTLPASVVPVATAIPAFIGYTKQRIKDGETLAANTPVRVTSMLEYEEIFGGPFDELFGITLTGTSTDIDDTTIAVTQPPTLSPYLMYYSLQMFYANGGGPCYVVSVGGFEPSNPGPADIDPAELTAGVDALLQEDEPTLLVVPEAVILANNSDRKDVYERMLAQCSNLQDRFTLMDTVEKGGTVKEDADDFRSNQTGTSDLIYGASYYPALKTSLTRFYTDGSIDIVDSRTGAVFNGDTLEIIKNGTPPTPVASSGTITITNNANIAGDEFIVGGTTFTEGTDFAAGAGPATSAAALETAINGAADPLYTVSRSGAVLTITAVTPGIAGDGIALAYNDTGSGISATVSGPGFLQGGSDGASTDPDKTLYNAITTELDKNRMVLYPSSTMAGVMARVDNERGVWKAPANVGVRRVIEPNILVSDEEQAELNVDATSGKSINVIRQFAGKGPVVWGARTLAGNDNEWRYVPVRRFFIFAEESIKKATEPVVFEPNDANTWLKVKAMIENFLSTLWRDGALAGAKPEDAFFVNVGLGTTMTSLDILEGRMNVEIGMAAVRPAEFIILKFSHKMQES
ncbi:MAG: phage tail sheath C-terminal domain-containing protein [Bacteroidota bacterium]